MGVCLSVCLSNIGIAQGTITQFNCVVLYGTVVYQVLYCALLSCIVSYRILPLYLKALPRTPSFLVF